MYFQTQCCQLRLEKYFTILKSSFRKGLAVFIKRLNFSNRILYNNIKKHTRRIVWSCHLLGSPETTCACVTISWMLKKIIGNCWPPDPEQVYSGSVKSGSQGNSGKETGMANSPPTRARSWLRKVDYTYYTKLLQIKWK